MVVVTGTVVGSVVVVGGMVWTVVGAVVGVGVPTLTEQPAIQTAATRSTARSKRDFLIIIIVTASFFLTDNCYGFTPRWLKMYLKKTFSQIKKY
jgi:hypothetical protein